MEVCIKSQIQNMNLVIAYTISCSYCYARNNVRRFHMIDDFERPEKINFSTHLDNAWFGVTVTSRKEKSRLPALQAHIRGGHYRVTFEPVFDDIGPVDLTSVEWVVIGTETRRRKGKSVSRPE